MTDRIAHRGPDDAGQWIDRAAGIALGHRRLAIVDLSAAGHQPMRSHSGRYTITYNGEVYNHRLLKRELDDIGRIAWRGQSDTEVLLAAIDQWGLERALGKCEGMFAFALWDHVNGSLVLARDRFGEKPLYYGRVNADFVFASEPTSLSAHPSFNRLVDPNALAAYFRAGYVPAPFSIWQGISKLEAGCYVVVSDHGSKISAPVRYWDAWATAHAAYQDPFHDEPTLVDQLEAAVSLAVRRRMEADVPLGAFLSGGVDSSLIVAMMQANSSTPVRTFTLGFTERGYDESAHARAVATRLGTEHHEMVVTPREAQSLIPDLPHVWDEPFSDSSQIPTALVSRLTRKHVTVALSGDGGDELFAGYNRHVLAKAWHDRSRRLPTSLRRPIVAALRTRTLAATLAASMRVLPTRYRLTSLVDRLPRLADVLDAPSADAMYRALTTSWPASGFVRNGREPDDVRTRPALDDVRATMMLQDTITYLPDDILTKVDRASMACSLETRVPFLDTELFKFAWRLPLSAKIKGGQGKHILREVLYRHVPRAMIDRPKAGFAIPLADWLTGPLREWADELLSPPAFTRHNLLEPKPIIETWSRFKDGRGGLQQRLWSVLMFQAWAGTHL